jgi:hypothetical protein
MNKYRTQTPHLPFLAALCWQTGGKHCHLEPEQQLTVYERGWRHEGILADLGEEERAYVRELAHTHGSWINV